MSSIMVGTLRAKIFDTISDMVVDLLYYDRKADDELPVGAIESSIRNGEISVDEILAEFKTRLLASLQL